MSKSFSTSFLLPNSPHEKPTNSYYTHQQYLTKYEILILPKQLGHFNLDTRLLNNNGKIS